MAADLRRQRVRALPLSPPSLAPLPLAPLALSALAFAPVCAASAESRHFETPGPALSAAISQERLVAGLGVGGVAWVPLDGLREDATLVVRPDWPSLTTLELDTDPPLTLLGGRDGILRVVDLADGPEGRLVLSWPGEGLPLGLAMSGSTLAVGGGGAGVSFWRWSGPDAVPDLVGRYPFIGYAKEVVFIDKHILAVADAYMPGVLLLDGSDPLRPTAVQRAHVKSFCDSIAAHPAGMLATDRAYGTAIFRWEERARLSERDPRVAPLRPEVPEATAAAVAAAATRAAIAETVDGVRLCVLEEGVWHDYGRIATPGPAVAVAFIDDDTLAIGLHANGLLVVPWPGGDGPDPDEAP